MNASTQPQLPLSKNGQLGLKRKRRRCGFCDFNVTINADRRMRIHGPLSNRCVGSGIKWTAVFNASRRKQGISVLWGTCGICGEVEEYEPSTSKAEQSVLRRKWLQKHSHSRPRITKSPEDGAWYVEHINTRTGVILRVAGHTYDDALVKAAELFEQEK